MTTPVLLVLPSLEELSQAFIPTRTCDFFDWLATVTDRRHQGPPLAVRGERLPPLRVLLPGRPVGWAV